VRDEELEPGRNEPASPGREGLDLGVIERGEGCCEGGGCPSVGEVLPQAETAMSPASVGH
jgi:hypothetical protein